MNPGGVARLASTLVVIGTAALMGGEVRGSVAASPPASAPPSDPAATDVGRFAWFESIGEEGGSQLLCVGRYDGRVFEAVRVRTRRLRAAGPVDGWVLAWWSDGDGSTLRLVDTGTGTGRDLVRTRRSIVGAAFGPGATYYYDTVDDRRAIVWKGDLASDEAPERVARGSSWEFGALKATPDRTAILITDIHPSDDPARMHSFRVLDTRTDSVRRVPGRAFEPVGLLGDEVVVWSEHPTGPITFPLRALAPDGTERIIVDDEGDYATIVGAVDGAPVLVFEGEDGAGRFTLSAIGPGPHATPALIHVADFPRSTDQPAQILWSAQVNGIESPGYVALMPESRAYQPDIAPPGYARPSRLLVSLDGSGAIDLGVQPDALPADTGCGGGRPALVAEGLQRRMMSPTPAG